MSNSNLSPAQFHPKVPSIVDAGGRPEGLPYKGGSERVLSPDHMLHATQGWYDPHSIRDMRDPDIREEADDEEGAPPRISHYEGKDYIWDGHHRITADRLEGRSTRVRYHE